VGNAELEASPPPPPLPPGIEGIMIDIF
jgi:hypothetical protein